MTNLWLGLGVVIGFAALIGFFTFLATRKGPGGTRRAMQVALRHIEALQSLPDTVGQAVETGQRLHISLGAGAVGQANTTTLLAGLTVLDQISEAAVMSDKPPVITTGDSAALFLAQDTLAAVYRRQNAEERYAANTAQVVGLTPLAFGAAQTTLPKAETIAGTVLIGSVGSEVVLMTEAGQRANVTTLAGTDNPQTQALLFVTADHPLVGEDVFAGGALIGRAPAHVASLQAQDLMRFFVAGAIVLGALWRTWQIFTGTP